MASDRGVPGAGVYGDLPPSYTRSQPPANPDVLRRPSYCHAAFALKQISKVMRRPRCSVDLYVFFNMGVQLSIQNVNETSSKAAFPFSLLSNRMWECVGWAESSSSLTGIRGPPELPEGDHSEAQEWFIYTVYHLPKAE